MLNVASPKYVNVICMMMCAKLLIEIETLILHNGCNIKKKPIVCSVCSFKVHFIMISCCKEIYFNFQMSFDIYITRKFD